MSAQSVRTHMVVFRAINTALLPEPLIHRFLAGGTVWCKKLTFAAHGVGDSRSMNVHELIFTDDLYARRFAGKKLKNVRLCERHDSERLTGFVLLFYQSKSGFLRRVEVVHVHQKPRFDEAEITLLTFGDLLVRHHMQHVLSPLKGTPGTEYTKTSYFKSSALARSRT